MIAPIVNIIAKNPPSILLAIGGLGYLFGMASAGIILVAGIILQIGWLARFFI